MSAKNMMLRCIMCIRSVKVRSSSGTVHEYVRMVESIRHNGRVRQKVVANLGRRDTLTAVLPLLQRFLQGGEGPSSLAPRLGQAGDVACEEASTWGPMRVARHLCAQLGLWQVLDAGRRWPKLLAWEDPCDDWPSRVLALVCKRRVRPGSEHALGAWLESDSVGDRGMVTESNLKALPGSDDAWGFLVGMTRRQNPAAEPLIDRVRAAAWLACPAGINPREKPEDRRPRTRVPEVPCDRPGVRAFVVDSDERRADQQRLREKAMHRVRTGLEKVPRRVAQGRLQNPAKIGAAVQRVLQRDHGYRYYDWQLRDGRLNIVEHPLNLPREKKHEGKYLIQTDQPQFTPEEALAHYQELNEVERGFHALKDPLGMRPIRHRVERRVRAHIFIAALAFLLDRMLERALREAGRGLSSRAAWTALETVRHVRFRVHGEVRTGVTPGSSRAREALAILKISDLRPPSPPFGEETTM